MSEDATRRAAEVHQAISSVVNAYGRILAEFAAENAKLRAMAESSMKVIADRGDEIQSQAKELARKDDRLKQMDDEARALCARVEVERSRASEAEDAGQQVLLAKTLLAMENQALNKEIDASRAKAGELAEELESAREMIASLNRDVISESAEENDSATYPPPRLVLPEDHEPVSES